MFGSLPPVVSRRRDAPTLPRHLSSLSLLSLFFPSLSLPLSLSLSLSLSLAHPHPCFVWSGDHVLDYIYRCFPVLQVSFRTPFLFLVFSSNAWCLSAFPCHKAPTRKKRKKNKKKRRKIEKNRETLPKPIVTSLISLSPSLSLSVFSLSLSLSLVRRTALR